MRFCTEHFKWQDTDKNQKINSKLSILEHKDASNNIPPTSQFVVFCECCSITSNHSLLAQKYCTGLGAILSQILHSIRIIE